MTVEEVVVLSFFLIAAIAVIIKLIKGDDDNITYV